jgi:hypothetical protein
MELAPPPLSLAAARDLPWKPGRRIIFLRAGEDYALSL